jgi:glycosyltransferase involved in cell wall biosynthesis
MYEWLPQRVLIASRCSWTTFNFRRHLIAELQGAGVNVLACGAGGDGYEEQLAAAGIRFVPLPLGRDSRDLLADLRYAVACYRLIREHRPDVVHTFTIKPVIYCTLAAALARVRLRVAMITGLGYAFTSSGKILRWLVSALCRFALRRVDLVYFQNADDRDEFLHRKIVSVSQCRMIAGSGVDTGRFAPMVRVENQNCVTFLMISRALREKGVLEFFAAAHQVKQVASDARFILVGGTDGRNPTSLVQEEVQLRADESGVEWAGPVGDVRPLIAEADVVVLPSYREGTPMSLLEAAAMAKPMIATNVPGCREIVRDGVTGWLVPPRDAQALAAAMIKAMAERERWRTYGENARNLATSRFDVRRVSKQIMDDYRELAARRGG